MPADSLASNPVASIAAPPRSRIVGIDVARGLALIGMFIAHAAPMPAADAGSVVRFLLELPDERSRLLFAITAGLGLGLLTGGTRPPGRAARNDRGGTVRGALRGQIAIRAVFLLALGFLLTATGVLVLVILDEYGVAFLLMIPLVFLPAWWLIGVGVAGVAVMPGLAIALATTPAVQEADRGGFALLIDWFVTGAYPVVIWVPVIMLGVGLVRLGLHRPAVVLGALGVGALAMVLGLGASIALGGERIEASVATEEVGLLALGTSVFTIGNVGFGIAVAMALIALTSLVSPGVSRVSSTVLSPLAAAGSMPLSVYTAHIFVLVLTTHEGEGGWPTDDSWATVVALVVGTLVLPWLWRRFIGRGPLEWLIGVVSGRIEAPRSGRSAVG